MELGEELSAHLPRAAGHASCGSASVLTFLLLEMLGNTVVMCISMCNKNMKHKPQVVSPVVAVVVHLFL